jgi:hypothetical protein
VLPKDSARFASQKIWFPASRPDAQLSIASSVRTTWFSVRTFLFVEKLQTAPACIRPDVSAAHPDDLQCSTSFRISFQNTIMGRLLQPSGRRGFPSGRAKSIRQVSQFKSNRPDAQLSNMEIACIRSPVRTINLLARTREAFIWKLLAADVRPSGRQGNTVRTRLSNRKDFQRNFRNFGRTVVRPSCL